jgi:hypothetical protein
VTLATLLLLFGLEGLLAFLWAFLAPAEIGGQVFLWLSPQRLLLAAGLLLISLAFFVAFWRARHAKSMAEALLGRVDGQLIDQGRLGPALLALTIMPILVAAAVTAILRTPLEYQAYRMWAPDTFPLLRSITVAAAPLLAFLALGCLETAIFLALRHRAVLTSSSTWSPSHIGPSALLLLIVIVTVFHWMVLIFQLRFFVNIPAWYWIFDPVPFGPGDLWYFLGALVLFGLAYWLLIVRHHLTAGLVLVFALGWFLQMGVGLMGGAGIQTLRERFFTTYHAVYVEKAAQGQIGILDGIRRYEEVYGSNTFTGTKAPGLMAFYNALERIINGSPSQFHHEIRYQRLADAVMLLLPMLAAGTALVLSFFTRQFLHDPSGRVQRVAPLLYVMAPNVALLTFFADQALYPLAFLLGAWICIAAVRPQSLAFSLALGVYLYAAALFTFTLLPLVAVTGAYLFLHYWRSRSVQGLRHIIWHALAVAAGALLLHLLARMFLNYDFLTRLQSGMTVHHNIDFYLRLGKQIPDGPEPFAVRLGQIFRAAWFNNLDLAAAIGFPIYILFFIQALRRCWRFLRSATSPSDAVVLAVLAGFVGINLVGSEQGEVPRLWLFWVPVIVLLAAYELDPHLRRQPRFALALGLSQLVTLMLTFHFQDLRM